MPATAQQVVPAIPFTQASHEHVEPFMTTIVATPGANAQVFEAIVPSYGYLRHVYAEVTSAGGTIGTGVLNAGADYPYTAIDAITLLDTNGAPIFGPLDGYATYWANAVGGYAFQNNLKNVPWFSGTINPNFSFRIPVEIAHHSGVGSLANQNAAAAYKVRLTVNPFVGGIVSTQGTATAPALTIRLALEAWSLPNEVDALGRPQAQVPPNHGTIQYWSTIKPQVVVGNNYTQITRVGNLIRNLVFLARTAAPALSDTVFPNPAIISWDARQLINETQNYRSQVMFERLLGQTRDAGVFAYSFDHDNDNHCGDDDPTLWLPTVQATRLELDGNSAAAGTIQILTNDVAPVALDQSQRYVETSGTGFHANPDR
jgi:hypothetical protein